LVNCLYMKWIIPLLWRKAFKNRNYAKINNRQSYCCCNYSTLFIGLLSKMHRPHNYYAKLEKNKAGSGIFVRLVSEYIAWLGLSSYLGLNNWLMFSTVGSKDVKALSQYIIFTVVISRSSLNLQQRCDIFGNVTD